MQTSINIPDDLNDRLNTYIFVNRKSIWGKKNEVLIEAIREYLDRHEEKSMAPPSQ
jgi:metal-responsive CopG/Arc/MetJ family transcriptional regulator